MIKNVPANEGHAKDMGLIPGSRRSPGGGHGNPFQFSCLENSMDRGAWRAIVHRVAELDTTESICTHTYTHTNKNNNLQGDIVIFYKEQLSLVHCFY